MADTETPEALLLVAVQDLHDAETAWTERLAGFAEKTGIGDFIAGQQTRSATQRERLGEIAQALGGDTEGPENIWLRAILDDADRDCATIVAGPLRDVAVVGAFRKGIQSERVSYETAIGLASKLGYAKTADTLTLSRDEEAAADDELARLLDAKIQSIE